MIFQKFIEISTQNKGLYLITDKVLNALPETLPQAGVLNCFIQHTSASLIVQENADPSAKKDLEEFLNRLAPDGEPWHEHTLEGDDDSTAHMKAAITGVSLNIPICSGRLALGTWQGIYLWEHRNHAHIRKVVLTMWGE